MTEAWVPLATVTLTAGATSVKFSNIPNSYRDLIAIVTPLHASGTHGGRLRLNDDSGSNYSYIQISGDGSSAAAYTGTNNGAAGWVAQTTESHVIQQIFDYSDTSKHKIILGRFARAENTNAEAVRWANTAAVNSVLWNLQGQTFAPGSRFSLWGSNRA